MSEWDPATKKQLNKIQVLLRENMSPDVIDADLYFKARELTGEDLCKGEASDLIEMFDTGRSQMAIHILKHTLEKKNGK